MTAGTHTHQVRWVASGAALLDRLAMMNMLGDREAPVAVSVDVFAERLAEQLLAPAQPPRLRCVERVIR